jgi:DNA mismatch repair ATPase MutS
MRIGDSLADGVSFYMAELKRLKEIVDQATGTHENRGPSLLFLLDEILLGTNSAERHIAVVRVIRHLLDAGALGVISTHDLELASSPELISACRPVHFREHIVQRDGKGEMVFDYRMRPGVATTTNALKLLELVGLGGK